MKRKKERSWEEVMTMMHNSEVAFDCAIIPCCTEENFG